MSNKVIWKYTFYQIGITTVEVPRGAEILSVASQRDVITMWYKCDPKAPKQERFFKMVPTGYECELDGWICRGIAMTHGGQFVYHIFEKPLLADEIQ